MILARELQLQRNLRKIQASTGFEPLKFASPPTRGFVAKLVVVPD